MPDPPLQVADIAIVGGGPTGLFAAFYAGLRQMSVKLIDSLDILGGQLATLYPEKYIYDVAGFPRVLSKDLVRGLIAQALQYNPAVCLGQQVTSLSFDPDTRIYSINTTGQSHRARTILIAAGIGAFRPKMLPIPEARRFERGGGLYYFAQSLEVFRGKRILIVGGGDSAVDWANTLAPLTAQQTLIHRRDQFRAHEDSVARMRQTTTDIKLFHELKAIDGRDGHIQRATIYDNRTKSEQTLDVDAVLVNIGFESSLGPVKDWQLELTGGQINVDSMMQTNRPGIFAAGDVATFPGKLKLIATGFAEACIAVNFAKHYIDPAAKIFPGHSSEMKR